MNLRAIVLIQNSLTHVCNYGGNANIVLIYIPADQISGYMSSTGKFRCVVRTHIAEDR